MLLTHAPSHSRRVIGSGAVIFAGTLLSLLALAGCSYFSFSDGVDYSGSYDQEVGACAEIAMKADLRADDGPVSTIWVRNVTVELLNDGAKRTMLIEGETHTSDTAQRVYAWSCDVAVDIPARTLTAEIIDFHLVDR